MGAALRVDAIRHKHQIEYDEAVTYLAATGHQGAYHAAVPLLSGRWVAASSWKDMVASGPFFVFGRIAADLAHYDNHPPLYFWLLHVWVALAGVSARSSPILNTAIAALTCLALFGFARYLLGDALEAAVVALTWAVALVALAGATLAVVRLWGSQRRRLLRVAAAAAGGIALFAALNPLFYLSIERQRAQQVHGFDLLGSSERWWAVERGLSESLRHGGVRPAVLALIAVVVVAVVVVAVGIPASRRYLMSKSQETGRGGLVAVYFLVVVGGLTVLLYVTGQSPSYGMHGRYLAAVWPFLAFGPVLVGHLFGRLGAGVGLAVCLLVVLPGGLLYVRAYGSPLPNVTALTGARRVLADSVVRGTLPRDLWYVPGSTLVFAARQDDVLAQPERWLAKLDTGDLYIAADGLGATRESRMAIMRRLSERFALSPLPGRPYGSSRLIELDGAAGGVP